MDFATGAFGALIPKLAMLLRDEYNLQKSVKGGVKFLMVELESMQAALEKVSGVPAEQLDKNVRLWARDVREMSYDIEDSVDTFLVRVKGNNTAGTHSLKGFIDRSLKSLSKFKIRRKIACDIDNIKCLIGEAKERRDRYNVDSIAVKPTTTSVDPRLAAMFRKMTELVGIDEARDELIKMLSRGDEASKKKLKVVSMVGLGGLGKTTLAKVVYDKLKVEFSCWAFVSVGQDPDVKKVLKDILLELDKEKFENIHNATRDEKQLINILHNFLRKKRYFVVIDDVWDIQSWETIRLALDENNCGSRIVTTTHKFEVAKEAGDVYKLQPLSYANSRLLFYTRILCGENKYPDSQLDDEVSDKILKKCGGVPLAIITMASLLAGKPREEWFEVYNSIGFGYKDNRHAENTMRILSFSYYDMPSHLRTCLLYLSVFPEDYIISKHPLIWKWIAEGFIHSEQGSGLFELGERYFNELVNRSMIQPVESEVCGFIIGCRLHDMVFGLIRSLSCEENFVTTVDDIHHTLVQSNVRRLSHQNRLVVHNPQAQMVSTHMRSFVACWCYIAMMVPHPTFRVLRVLALEECLFMEGYHLSHLGDLVHLRYLGLEGTPILELPKEIRELKFLQTLALERTGIEQLPSCIGLLTQLACLRVDTVTRNPADEIIGKLTSLEELHVSLGSASNDNKECTRKLMPELRNLKELRMLYIHIGVMDDSLEVALLDSLSKLPKLRHLRLDGSFSNILKWEMQGFVHALHLRSLNLADFILSSLPPWINCSLLPNLSSLSLNVQSMDYRDMRILGRFPQLYCLDLWTSSTFVVHGGYGYFQMLRFLWTNTYIMFRGDKSGGLVMPSLEDIKFYVTVRSSKDICVHHGKDISFLPVVIGLHMLPSLDKIRVTIDCKHAMPGEVDELEEALRNVANSHPNQPTLEMRRYDDVKMIKSDENLQWPSLNCRDVIDYHVHVRELKDIGYGFDFTHLVNLPLLGKVIACINCEDASAAEVEEAVAAMRHAVDIHPNHPSIEVERYGEDKCRSRLTKMSSELMVEEDDASTRGETEPRSKTNENATREMQSVSLSVHDKIVIITSTVFRSAFECI